MAALVHQLRRWQGRERFYRVALAASRWLALVVAGLTACGLLDWTIDRYTDTPRGLRWFLSVAQLALYAVAARYLFARLNVPAIDDLATLAERKYPDFGHRLVTSLQLNRPGAKTQGMSAELIASVTREAEAMSERRDLAALADRSRLKTAAIFFAPVLLVVAVCALFLPKLSLVLLSRQAFLNVEIPRRVHLESDTPELWPSGDEVTLRVKVTGEYNLQAVGSARVQPDDQPAETYPLAYDATLPDGSAIYAARLPAGSAPFTYRARLQDGRMRSSGRVRFEPRPVVKEIAAWLVLPAYVDPAGKKRYERFQPQGEVTALPGCGLRVEITASKPAKSATVIVSRRDAAGAESVAVRVPMALDESRQNAAAFLDLPSRASSYRIELMDDNDFANANPPRRGIAMAADDPPRVNLLSEVLKDPKEPGPLDDYDVSGMPLVLGGQVQIGYAGRSPLGLSSARIMYRVNDGDWTPLPLALTLADAEKLGKFVPELGVFENSGPFGQVEFYPLPAADADADPAGLEAGGRYSFQTAALLKKTVGGNAKLEVGDRVEFYVESFDRNPAKGRPGGKSESRFKTVSTQAQLEDWTRQRDQSRERLKQLEERQRGVFKPGNN